MCLFNLVWTQVMILSAVKRRSYVMAVPLFYKHFKPDGVSTFATLKCTTDKAARVALMNWCNMLERQQLRLAPLVWQLETWTTEQGSATQTLTSKHESFSWAINLVPAYAGQHWLRC